jgi:hypothetical protein
VDYYREQKHKQQTKEKYINLVTTKFKLLGIERHNQGSKKDIQQNERKYLQTGDETRI